MAQTNDIIGTVLRLRRELMSLSSEARRALLAEMPESQELATPARPEAPTAPRRSKKVRYVLKKKKGRKRSADSAKAQAVKIVLGSPRPVWAAEVISAVLKMDPKARKNALYTGLHEAAEDGTITKEMIGTKARYSKPSGGNKQHPDL